MKYEFETDHKIDCFTCPLREINFSTMKALKRGYLCRHPQKEGNRYVYPESVAVDQNCPFFGGK